MKNLIEIGVSAFVTIGMILVVFFVVKGNNPPGSKPNTITIRGAASEVTVELTSEDVDMIFEDLDEIISRRVVQND